MLLDSALVPRSGGITTATGSFQLDVPAPGTYVLRVERIGYETPPDRSISVEAGSSLRLDLEIVVGPIALEGIEVEGQRRCVVRPEQGLIVAEVWDEAVKALRNQDWNARQGSVRFQLREYSREFEPTSGMVTSEQRSPVRWTSGQPFYSLPVQDLLADGFVRPAGDGDDALQYFAPDASVLLSREFLDTHCLRLSSNRRQGMIGVEFEPVADRGNDIDGTLWLDSEDARPRFLEFEYTRATLREARGLAGGRIDFEELPGGNWIVRRWWIRMPRMIWDSSRMYGGDSGYRVAAMIEQGGEVGSVRTPLGSLAGDHSTGSIRGIAYDSTGTGPLPDADVVVIGTSHRASSDSLGRFRIDRVPVGTYDVTLHHRSLDSLGVSPQGFEVEVLEHRVAELDLSLPYRHEILEALCPELRPEDVWLAVVGEVRDGRTREAVPDAEVTLTWNAYAPLRTASRKELTVETERRHTVTDRRGRYVICGIPPGVHLEGWAEIGQDEGRIRSPRSLPYRSVVPLYLDVPRR